MMAANSFASSPVRPTEVDVFRQGSPEQVGVAVENALTASQKRIDYHTVQCTVFNDP